MVRRGRETPDARKPSSPSLSIPANPGLPGGRERLSNPRVMGLSSHLIQPLAFTHEETDQRGADTFQSSPSKAALVPWASTHGTEDLAMMLPLNTYRSVTTGRSQDSRKKPHYLWAVYPTLSLAPDPRDYPR